jgi:hypothetical protein
MKRKKRKFEGRICVNHFLMLGKNLLPLFDYKSCNFMGFVNVCGAICLKNVKIFKEKYHTWNILIRSRNIGDFLSNILVNRIFKTLF